MIALPEPRVAPLRGGAGLSWAVLGPGRIAADWVGAVHRFTEQRVVSVGSRDAARAAEFAARLGIPNARTGYAAAVDDPAVDAVYIATPNPFHVEHALLALAAGKHVLVEKPIAMDAAGARRIAEAAAAVGRFAMEAMWTRFLPRVDVLDRLLADGALGELSFVSADCGMGRPYDPASRSFDPALGGGSLWDMGVYSLWFCHAVLGAPATIAGRLRMAPTGVDDQATAVLGYRNGAQAVAFSSITTTTGSRALVAGDAGRIELDGPFIGPGGVRLVATSGDVREWHDPSGMIWRDGLAYQVAAMAAHVAAGRTEAPEHPLGHSVAVLEVIDRLRADAGLTPG